MGGESVEFPSIGMLNDGGGAYRGGAKGQAGGVKCWSSELSAVGDGDLRRGFAVLAAAALHLLHHLVALHHLPEHHVLPIEPAGGGGTGGGQVSVNNTHFTLRFRSEHADEDQDL